MSTFEKQLRQLFPKAPANNIEPIIRSVPFLLADYGLTTPKRLAHFWAQVGHESGGLRWMSEIWGPTAAQNRYEGRVDLGNTEAGDGFRYRGAGPFQLTGRYNYRKYGKFIGLDIEKNPELARRPDVGIHIALEYWKQNNLNALADKDDIETITKRINGGLNGYSDRVIWLARAKQCFGAGLSTQVLVSESSQEEASSWVIALVFAIAFAAVVAFIFLKG